MANIFISYTRQSAAVARNLAGDIEALGHTVWIDSDLSGGQAWWDQILENIRGCAVFVFILDPESLNSTACKREYGYAADLGKPILPVLVSSEVSINVLPPALSEIQFVDYRKQDRAAAFRLARALANIRPPKKAPDPLPAPPKVPISYLGGLARQVDTQTNLTYGEQSGLVVDLRNSLREPGTAEDARKLLKRLRKRRDLLAIVADEIDGFFKGAEPSNQIEPSKSASPAGSPKPAWQGRLKGAGIMVLVGGLAWVLSMSIGSRLLAPVDRQMYLYLFAISGTFAGVVSGTNRIRVVAVLLGFIVAASIQILMGDRRLLISLIIQLSAPLLGAFVGVYIEKRNAKR